MLMQFLQKLRSIIYAPALLNPPPKFTSLLFSSIYASLSSSSSSSSSDTNTESPNILTHEELTKINLLIPRLCSSDHLPEAICLVDAALLANPPLKSLSLSVLVDHLSAEPDLAHSMSLLNRLKRNPRARSSLLPITKSVVSSYFKKGKPGEAMKVFDWMSWPDSPCAPDSAAYAIVVNGFCRNAMVLEALKVLRKMLSANLVPGAELGDRVYKGLLREARIKEAQELNEALGSVGDGDESIRNVLILLDHMIGNWVE